MRFRTGVAAALVGAAFVGTASADSPMTPDQAKTLARSINLVDADLPGWTGEREPRETREDRELTDKYLACAGALRDRSLAEVASHSYQSPDAGEDGSSGASISSRVVVQRSAGLARHDFAAITSRHALKCLAKYGTAPTKGTTIRVSTLPSPAPGVKARRMRIHFGRELGGVKLNLDLLWFRRGPAEVLLAAGFVDSPVDVAQEQRLITILLTRAEQQIP